MKIKGGKSNNMSLHNLLAKYVVKDLSKNQD